MPIYMYRCPAGHQDESFVRIAERKPRKAVKCSTCGRRARRSFRDELRTNVKPFKAYYDVGLGQVVHSAEEIDRVAKDAGLVVMGRVP